MMKPTQLCDEPNFCVAVYVAEFDRMMIVKT